MRLSSRKVGGPDGPLAALQPFDTYGALRAVSFSVYYLGRLPEEWRRKYESDRHDPGIRYTVVSYATPIAWVLTDGATVIPDETYSVTTSRHQSLVRAWLATAAGVRS